MLPPGAKTKGSDHEIVILAHLVQMVKVVRKVGDEDIAQALGVSPGEAAQMLSESAKPTFEQLRKLFLAVGMATDGIFETHPGHPEKTVLAAEGFGNAIERGLEILNETDPQQGS
jgi:transcriptional regulator with XRE-family HTH domain